MAGGVGILRHLPYLADVQRQSLAFAGRLLSFSGGGVGDVWQRGIERSVGCSGAVRLGGVEVPQLRVLSRVHGGSAAFRAMRGGSTWWSLLSTTRSTSYGLSPRMLSPGWSPEDWGMVAANVDYVTGVVGSGNGARRCLWGKVGYRFQYRHTHRM